MIPAFFLVLLLAGCGGNFKPSSVARITSSAKHGYVIRLDYSYRAYGGPCNFSLIGKTISDSDWIFTDTTNGVVSADHLTLWHGDSPDDTFGWAVQSLIGKITVSNGRVRIDFQEPVYGNNDAILRHDQYRMNGNYKLESQ
jgi:hypothetical protein